VTISGGGNARLVVLAMGYAKNSDAQADAKAFASELESWVTNPVQWFVLDSKVDQQAVRTAIASATGILLTSPDQSLVLNAFTGAPDIASAVKSAWWMGKSCWQMMPQPRRSSGRKC